MPKVFSLKSQQSSGSLRSQDVRKRDAKGEMKAGRQAKKQLSLSLKASSSSPGKNGASKKRRKALAKIAKD